MTTSTVRILHCDFAGCGKWTPDNHTDGWTDAIYTHGCPKHGELVAAHRAKVTSDTRGRGAREKTTWYLTCACGWHPTPHWQVHNATWLKEQHLAHARDSTAA